MNAPRILAFSGSGRKESFNQQLVQIAAQSIESEGLEVTTVNLADFELPIFDQDLEASGTPAGASKLKSLMIEHQGFLIACPEYNSSITPLLKNAIDWASRPAEGEAPLAAYQGKTAALLSASPGALGGMRGLNHVRSILTSIGVHVLPSQVAVPKIHELLKDGGLMDAGFESRIQKLGRELAAFTRKLAG